MNGKTDKGDTRNRRRRTLRRLLGLALFALLALSSAGLWLYFTADATVEQSLSARQVIDVTRLERIQVGRVVEPKTTEEVSRLLSGSHGPISIGGARASMGGQIAEPGSLHLDMRQMNRVVSFAPERREITVQAGMTWRALQDVIDPHDLSVRIMQTYANFTVGGALSVNAHGRYMGRGPVVQSVKHIQLVLADGTVTTASPEERRELFYGAIGGYGGLGVITEVTLDLDPNQKVQRTSVTMDTANYRDYFFAEVRQNPKVIFHNADLHPPDFDTARAISWVETDAELTEAQRLIPRGDTYTWTPRLINGMVDLPGGHWIREHLVEPLFYAPNVVTWRNHEASYDIAELEPEDRDEVTYALREYFVPEARFEEFVSKMRDVFSVHQVEVINVSVRHASKDPGTLLAWSRGETFAFVVYYQQGTSPEAIDRVGQWSRELVDAVLEVGGTYYLPYQNHPTREQFQRAYPRAEEYFALKRRVDPQLRFQNQLFYHYGPNPRAKLATTLSSRSYERKPEAQTLLTVPEWYLVFNPGEYARHLESGAAPDAFPFFESVREYWSLYKKVRAEADAVYPPNDEYLTMLQVIGVSTTVEYLAKGVYEATVGRLFRAFASQSPNREEHIVQEAFRAYEQLIYDRPWYDFEFLPWIVRIWRETSLGGPDVLRRTERKLAFTGEFAAKSLYATVLGKAAKTAYEPAQERLQLVVRSPGSEALKELNVLLEAELDDGLALISVERWKEFSEVVPRLAAAGVDFVEIAGNDDIAVSLVEDRQRRFESPAGQRLFSSRVVTDPREMRSVWFVPVTELGGFLRSVRERGVRLEHLYDY